jgi:hypothetical protein
VKAAASWRLDELGMTVKLVILVAVAAWAVGASAAVADFGSAGFDGAVLRQDGSVASQAGGHPYAASTTIEFNQHMSDTQPVPDADVKDIAVELPPGFVGDPTATGSRCGVSALVDKACPVSSQVGLVVANAVSGEIVAPVYNMSPPPGAPGEFGFVAVNTPVLLTPSLRSGTDYGLTVNALDVSQADALFDTTVTFWGVPADASHDLQRCARPELGADPLICDDTSDDLTAPHSAGVPRVPFLRNPTSCTPAGVGLETKLSIDSWQNPGVFEHASFFSHMPGDPLTQIGPTGCDIVPFDPSLSAQPGSSRASAPSGWAFDVSLPQNENPDGLAQADLTKAVVTLPQGVRVSPSAADGLDGCSQAQIGLHSTADPTCPDSSKIGTLTITTPLLDEPLTGALYLASPNDNQFHSLLAIYLVAKGPGLIVKLPGKITPDPITGQISTTFDNNPQLPFSNLHLEFKNGPRSPLVNPATCGTYTTHAQLTSWSGKTVNVSNSFTVDQSSSGGACKLLGFAPDFVAGTQDPIAGQSTSFLLALSRGDGDQELKALTVRMPQGLLGKIASTTLCGAAAAKAGTCGEASRVGSVTVGAGAGSNPFFITAGRAYITGPYKGAPFGLSIVVPAKAGPFDLGNVVVRSAIFVDKHTAALKVVSDPLPTILQGIPLDVREVRVSVDKPGFIRNPTSCASKHVGGTITSTQGRTANVSTHFEVASCASLKLAPKLSLKVGGKGHTGHGASTPLTTTLTQTPGQSNLKTVAVTLPLSLNARLEVVNNACTQAQFDAGHCEDARAGSAVAVTPLLKHALRGGAYFVKDPTKPAGSLPNLMVALRGQVDFDLVGHIRIPGGTRLATRFTAPDVPIKKFTLSLVAGSHGPLGIATNLCSPKARKAMASVAIRGQNGDLIRRQQRLQIAGCPHKRARR